MATRFYLLNSTAAPDNWFKESGSWEVYQANYWLMSTTRQSYGTDSQSYYASDSVTRSVCQYVGNSQRLVGDGTISGTISMVIKCIETNAKVNAHLAYRIYVINGQTNQIRGQLAAFQTTSTEYPTTAATRIHSARALTSQAYYDGDYLLLEVGHYYAAPTTSDYTAGFTIRDDNSTDYALTAGLTTDLNSWVELSQSGLTFKPADITGESTATTALCTTTASGTAASASFEGSSTVTASLCTTAAQGIFGDFTAGTSAVDAPLCTTTAEGIHATYTSSAKLYTTNSNTSPITPSYTVMGWGLSHGGTDRTVQFLLSTDRMLSEIADTTKAYRLSTDGFAAGPARSVCGVSPPFDTSTTLGKLDIGHPYAYCQFTDGYLAVCVYSVDSSGTLKHTFTQYGFTAPSDYFWDGDVISKEGIPLDGGTVDIGDRLVVEIGVWIDASTTTYNFIRLGDPSGFTEYALGGGQSSTQYGWVKIWTASSSPISFASNKSNVTAVYATVTGSGTVDVGSAILGNSTASASLCTTLAEGSVSPTGTSSASAVLCVTYAVGRQSQYSRVSSVVCTTSASGEVLSKVFVLTSLKAPFPWFYDPDMVGWDYDTTKSLGNVYGFGLMSPNRYWSKYALGQTTVIPVATSASIRCTQFITHPLTQSATISGHMNLALGQVGMLNENRDAYISFALHIINGVTGEIKHTLVSSVGDNDVVVNYFTEHQSRYVSNIDLTSATAEIGDRLGLDVGFYMHSTASAGTDAAYFRIGDPLAGQLAPIDGYATTSAISWMELPDIDYLHFEPFINPISSATAILIRSAASGTIGRVDVNYGRSSATCVPARAAGTDSSISSKRYYFFSRAKDSVAGYPTFHETFPNEGYSVGPNWDPIPITHGGWDYDTPFFSVNNEYWPSVNGRLVTFKGDDDSVVDSAPNFENISGKLVRVTGHVSEELVPGIPLGGFVDIAVPGACYFPSSSSGTSSARLTAAIFLVNFANGKLNVRLLGAAVSESEIFPNSSTSSAKVLTIQSATIGNCVTEMGDRIIVELGINLLSRSMSNGYHTFDCHNSAGLDDAPLSNVDAPAATKTPWIDFHTFYPFEHWYMSSATAALCTTEAWGSGNWGTSSATAALCTTEATYVPPVFTYKFTLQSPSAREVSWVAETNDFGRSDEGMVMAFFKGWRLHANLKWSSVLASSATMRVNNDDWIPVYNMATSMAVIDAIQENSVTLYPWGESGPNYQVLLDKSVDLKGKFQQFINRDFDVVFDAVDVTERIENIPTQWLAPVLVVVV